ncbi:MAG: DUF1565 domain-containing protein [Spirochaetales bacterium]|nr:DUF1565 domain-containing protein [Spirochaetales bacterium]
MKKNNYVNMNAGRGISFFLLTGLIFFAFYNCKNPMGITIKEEVEDYSKPTYTITPVSGDGISRTTSVKIKFSESMDPGSLKISGTLAAERGKAIWSARKSSNDTLTIHPKDRWTHGSGKTLVINCNDLDGYEVPAISLTYGVLDRIVYVHAGKGNDDFPGTPDKPKKTIQAAVDLAERYYDEAEVHVAEGMYLVGTPITIRKSIFLYGEYNVDAWKTKQNDSDWSINEDINSIFPTQIYSLYESTGEKDDPYWTIFILNSYGSMLEGFHIQGGSGTKSNAIAIVSGSSIICNNYIQGGKGDNQIDTILITNSIAEIKNNYIYGGITSTEMTLLTIDTSNVIVKDNHFDTGIGEESHVISNINSAPLIINNKISSNFNFKKFYGIANLKSNCFIINNIISGGEIGEVGDNPDTIEAIGIYNEESSPYILNNTICSGLSINISYAIYNRFGSSPHIENNLIFTKDSRGECTGIAQVDSKPNSIKNNNIFDCYNIHKEANILYVDNTAKLAYSIAETLNSLSFASGNVSLDPAFVDNDGGDFHLTASSPIEVRQGGLDLSAQFTEDKDGNKRTAVLSGSPANEDAAGWSMGAYESD